MIKKSGVAGEQISLTADELSILCNALNEVCHGLDIREFSTRMGAEKDEVLKLLNRLSNALDSRS